MAFPTDFAPQSDVGVGVSLKFEFLNDRFGNFEGAQRLAEKDWGRYFHKVRFKGMASGGYIVKITLFDSEMVLLPELIQTGYFEYVRKTPVLLTFRLFRQPIADKTDQRKSTREQKAIVFSMTVRGRSDSKSYVEIIAIDPPSWFLNTGDASGGVITGNVSSVIEQVIQRYTQTDSRNFPGGLRYEVSPTRDAKTNKWYLMRQDPKTFIASLLDWSSTITPQQTHWLISMDGNPTDGGPHIAVKEQAAYDSNQRGYYTFREPGPNHMSTILSWEILSNNALSIAQSKIVTQGVSVLTGEYFDKRTDKAQQETWVTDFNTENKRIARVQKWQSTSKPPAGVSASISSGIGITSVQSIPEFYSAGDLGIDYREYVDGRARSMYLGMLNNLIRLKIRVLGHGEWSNTFGLGIDTVFLNWTKEPGEENQQFYFAAGNWLIFGFEHHATRRQWYTDLWVARWDYDAVAVGVPGIGADFSPKIGLLS